MISKISQSGQRESRDDAPRLERAPSGAWPVRLPLSRTESKCFAIFWRAHACECMPLKQSDAGQDAVKRTPSSGDTVKRTPSSGTANGSSISAFEVLKGLLWCPCLPRVSAFVFSLLKSHLLALLCFPLQKRRSITRWAGKNCGGKRSGESTCTTDTTN